MMTSVSKTQRIEVCSAMRWNTLPDFVKSAWKQEGESAVNIGRFDARWANTAAMLLWFLQHRAAVTVAGPCAADAADGQQRGGQAGALFPPCQLLIHS